MKILWTEILKNPPVAYYANARVFPAGMSRSFTLKHFWAFNVYEKYGEIITFGRSFSIKPGSVCLIPPDTRRTFDYSEPALHRVVHFSLDIENNHPDVKIPLISDYSDTNYFIRKFDDMLYYFARENPRCVSILWQMLWTFGDVIGKGIKSEPRQHPSLKKAVNMIEGNLNGKLVIKDIAKKCGISHNQLIRLFHGAFKVGVAEYISGRRTNLARHMLVHSDMPIKKIANETGFCNLQHFNKFIRRRLGLSPRAFRGEHILS
jgi:AraC-like DNA-binding protein